MCVVSARGLRLRSLVLLIIGLLTAGCGGNSKPVYPVEGQVLVEGKPADRAVVVFHPVGDSSPDAVRPVGHADSTGKFSLTSFQEGDGAPAGEYAVTVTWYRATRVAGRGDEYVSRNYLPARYASPQTANLHVTVSANGPNKLEPFQLRSK